ncbi:MAG: RNA-guided pseudouridylation complex pseudouridine synthase subunit Cbf5 [Promethearchaeota archaeon]
MSRKLPINTTRAMCIKAEEDTDPAFGCKPVERTMSQSLDMGVINVDKVAGPTSHEVVSWIKRVFNGTNVTKTGHGGTLDPKVTGILPTALNKATRAVDVMLTAGKEYVCILELHAEIQPSKIENVMKMFEGKIYQRPPVRSAVKRNLRIREIYYIDILETLPKKVLFKVGCQAGTYIRKLCYDFGEVLGCGAHMGELRRTQSGPFIEDETLVTLQDIADAVYYWLEENDGSELRRIVQPMEVMFSHVPKIIVRDSAVDPVCHGASLTAPGILQVDESIKKDDDVAMFTQKGEIIALGTSLIQTQEILKENTGFMVKTTRVFMEPGTYPRWIKKSE